jgi:ADP-ribosylglycohydrolase
MIGASPLASTGKPLSDRVANETERTPPLRERFLGCLLAGAVGDALGAPLEFLRRDEILREFGAQGLRDYAPAYGGIGRITDDTQMTLFTAEGLLRAWVRGQHRGITTYSGVTANAYLRWLATQGESPPAGVEAGSATRGWLFGHPALHARRAPGETCLAALRGMRRLGDAAGNDSKGCGGVMRVAPAGLFVARLQGANAPERSFRLGIELAAITHGHPSGQLSAGAFAAMIQLLAAGESLETAIVAAKALLEAEPGHGETLMALERAEAQAAAGVSPAIAIRRLGEGWVAEEALGIAVYCALAASSLSEALLLAVNHDGDSDSTGAMAGNLLGARDGLAAIPPRWLEPLELRDVIAELAGDLYDFADWDIGEYATDAEFQQRIWQKYPGL